MQTNHSRKGFTLIEMLVVIAIIAVLVAIIIPTVTSATTKAKAATDAANLRSVLGQANSELLAAGAEEAAVMAGIQPISCKSFDGAIPYMAYLNPGFMIPYYVVGENYYSLEYFAEVAETGSSSQSTSQPSGYTWYRVGGEVEAEGD